MDKPLVKEFGQKYSDKHQPSAAAMRYARCTSKHDSSYGSTTVQSLHAWATAPKSVLPENAPTAGYLCGGGGIFSAGFCIAFG
ncbi:hypothetical protein IQ264_08220 [Phormidium sp. LEGE 05292]|uniref:hypothetical protein n=1 Tax=[Phormidium] sp. LEGE 05292 TaxID=767427 RepID=UPI00187EE99D|nr:hypothetical protein [Phormidium sp. LEGE 05292]MBE9225415.1 hypothetical protein [Phormidium sp. LEGE 05292]